MACKLVCGLLALAACAAAASISGTAGIDPSQAYIGGRLTFPEIPGINAPLFNWFGIFNPFGGLGGNLGALNPFGGLGGNPGAINPLGGFGGNLGALNPVGGLGGNPGAANPLGGLGGNPGAINPFGGFSGNLGAVNPVGGLGGNLGALNPFGGLGGNLGAVNPVGGLGGNPGAVNPIGGLGGNLGALNPFGGLGSFGGIGGLGSINPIGGFGGSGSNSDSDSDANNNSSYSGSPLGPFGPFLSQIPILNLFVPSDDETDDLLRDLPYLDDYLAKLPGPSENRTGNYSLPSFSLPNPNQGPYIPGYSEAIDGARKNLKIALNITADLSTGLRDAVAVALDSDHPADSIRIILNTIASVYSTVAANCPLLIVGARVFNEGIRLAGEVARSVAYVTSGF